MQRATRPHNFGNDVNTTEGEGRKKTRVSSNHQILAASFGGGRGGPSGRVPSASSDVNKLELPALFHARNKGLVGSLLNIVNTDEFCGLCDFLPFFLFVLQ